MGSKGPISKQEQKREKENTRRDNLRKAQAKAMINRLKRKGYL